MAPRWAPVCTIPVQTALRVVTDPTDADLILTSPDLTLCYGRHSLLKEAQPLADSRRSREQERHTRAGLLDDALQVLIFPIPHGPEGRRCALCSDGRNARASVFTIGEKLILCGGF